MKTLKTLVFLACVLAAASVSMPTRALDCTAQVLGHSGSYPNAITYYGRIVNNTGVDQQWYIMQTIFWGAQSGGCVCDFSQTDRCQGPVTVPAYGYVDVQITGTPPTGKTCAQYSISAGVNTCLQGDVLCGTTSGCQSIL